MGEAKKLVGVAAHKRAEMILTLIFFGAGGRPFTRRDDFDFVLLWGGLPLRVLQGWATLR